MNRAFIAVMVLDALVPSALCTLCWSVWRRSR